MTNPLIRFLGRGTLGTGADGLVEIFNSNFQVMNPSVMLAVAKGEITGHAVVHRSARNLAVGTTLEDVWQTGGVRATPSAGETLEILSSDANDTAAGSGAQEVTVVGIRTSDFTELSEVFATNGVSAVGPSVASFSRVNDYYVSKVGTYGGGNAGVLTARKSSAGAVYSTIPIGLGRAEDSHYTVPASKTAYLMGATFVVDPTQSGSVFLFSREAIDDVTTPFTPINKLYGATGVAGEHPVVFYAPIQIPEKTDIWAACLADASTTKVSVEYSLLLVDN